MPDPTPQQLAAIDAQFNSHPAIQQFIAEIGQGRNSVIDMMRAYSRAARDLGIQVPHDYQPTIQNGKVKLEKKSFVDRNGWFLPAVAVGAPLLAGAAIGGIAGAGGAGAAGGGAGAAGAGGAGTAATGGAAAAGLEGAATTGLAGSGFGTGGGLGITAVGAGSGAAAPILGSTATVPTAGTLPAGGSSILGDSTLAPGGGGWADRLLNRDTIIGAGNIIGGALTAAQQNAREEELNQIRRDALQLDRDRFALGAPETRLDTSVHASRILNHEPVKAHWGGPGSGLRGETVRFTGGSANPNLIDQRTRDLSDDVLNQQLQDQMERDDAINPNDPDAPVPPARRRLPAPGSVPPPDVAIPRR